MANYEPDWSSVDDLGDVFDSREAIAWAEQWDAMNEDERVEEYSADGIDEASKLREAIEEAADAGIADWEYGETFIHDNYFEKYARELADDIGAVSKDASWPQRHIDWEAAAEELLIDYTEVEMGRHTYWVRDGE